MINILPQKQKKELLHEYRIRVAITIFFMVGVLGFFATILMIPSYIFSKSKEILIEKQLEDFNKNNPELGIEKMNNIISDINLKLKTLDLIWQDDVYLNEIIGNILNLKPKGISVTQFLYNERTDGAMVFEIHGKADNRVVLRDFKIIMENQTDFSNVDLPISNFVQKKDIDYTITFLLKETKPKVETKR